MPAHRLRGGCRGGGALRSRRRRASRTRRSTATLSRDNFIGTERLLTRRPTSGMGLVSTPNPLDVPGSRLSSTWMILSQYATTPWDGGQEERLASACNGAIKTLEAFSRSTSIDSWARSADGDRRQPRRAGVAGDRRPLAPATRRRPCWVRSCGTLIGEGGPSRTSRRSPMAPAEASPRDSPRRPEGRRRVSSRHARPRVRPFDPRVPWTADGAPSREARGAGRKRDPLEPADRLTKTSRPRSRSISPCCQRLLKPPRRPAADGVTQDGRTPRPRSLRSSRVEARIDEGVEASLTKTASDRDSWCVRFGPGRDDSGSRTRHRAEFSGSGCVATTALDEHG